jgi:hypothetical protein
MNMSYGASVTAILLVGPYNDFLSEGGKLWPRVKPVAEEVGFARSPAGGGLGRARSRIDDLFRPA